MKAQPNQNLKTDPPKDSATQQKQTLSNYIIGFKFAKL
jgi:hypothetical protein